MDAISISVAALRRGLGSYACWLASFVVWLVAVPARADLVITEIHYAPVAADGRARDDLEFVEIFNDGPEAYDLSGYAFTRGLSFVFEEGTFIDGRSFLVICRDESALRAEYGISNTLGDFIGSLDNSGETIELANPQGIGVSKVRYNDRGQWPSGAKGTGHSLSIEYEYRDPDDPDNWSLSVGFGGSPGRTNFADDVSFEDTEIVGPAETWRYFKGNVSPPSAWRTTGFNDASWLSGATGIGYGDGDDRTQLNDMRGSYLTVFCRKTFSVADRDAIDSLILQLTIDDGFVAYLNGAEVGRQNVTGTGFNDEAQSAGEPEQFEVNLTSRINQLVEGGNNVLAVSVHNAGLDSSDLSFIPRLLSRRTIQPEETETIPVVVNEGHFRTAGTRFVELYNDSDSAVDISGYWLSDSFADLDGFEIPAATVLPARGFVSYTEAELGFDLGLIDGVRDRVEIALSNPSQTRVVDARLFEPGLDELSEARVPDGEENFAPGATPTPGAPNEVPVVRDVVINEIMYHPIDGSTTLEFIEIYNRGDVAQDLTGWSIEGVGFDFPSGTQIDAGAYLVIAKSPSRIESTYGLGSDVLLDSAYPGQLSNGGEKLRLLDAVGNEADKVRYYDGGDWSHWADAGGSSLEKIDPFGEGSVADSWDASDDSSKAVSTTVSYTARHGGGESDLGILLLAEGISIVDNISVAPQSGGSNLVSNGTFNSSTSGWRIEGTHIRSGRTTNADEVLSGAGSLKLISHNGTGDYKVNRCETNTGSQSNGTTYRISYQAKWQVGSPSILTIGDYNVGNASSSGLAGSNLLRIPGNLGSPGAINTVTARQIDRLGSANKGPAIDRVEHTPCIPESGEPVRVRARVRDADGVASVRLFYRTNMATGSYTQVSLTDPDSNGIWSGMIPGQTNGTRVIYYVLATDDEGLEERYPRDILERSHPPVVNPATAGPVDELYCLYRHDTRFPSTSFHSVRFVLHEENEEELRTRRVLSNEMLEGTFNFGGRDCYYNSKLRFAGSPWLRPGGGSFEKSYSFKIPKDNPLHGRKTAFNFDEHGADGRERYSHFLLRRMAGDTRLPYFDFQSLVRFQLNDVETGTYEMLDKPNRQYIGFWFPENSDGPHFEMDDRFSFNDSGGRTGNAEGKVLYPPYGGTAGGANKENFRWFFASRNRKGLDDFQPLQSFCRIMDARTTSSSAFDSQIWNVADVEEFLRVFAVEMNIDHWDTWSGNRGKNCYFFKDPTSGLWYLVPWDLELTYDQTQRGIFNVPSTANGSFSNHFSEITRMLNRPRIKRMYWGILKEMLDEVFFTGGNSPLSRYASELSGSGVSAGNVLNHVNARRSYLLSRVRTASSETVDLIIETNGGADFSTDESTVDLDGEAPADVFSLIVQRNGELLEDVDWSFSNSNLRDWSIDDIPVVNGLNTLTVIGFNSRGEIVDQDVIRVTSAGAFEQPAIISVTPDPAPPESRVTIVGTDFHDGIRVFFSSSFEGLDVQFDEASDPTRLTVLLPPDLPIGIAGVDVRNIDGQISEPVFLSVREVDEGPVFVRGDANNDVRIDLSDAVKILQFLFLGDTASCLDAFDIDDSGTILINDAVLLLDWLFRGGDEPADPFPSPGVDPTTADPLDCAEGV